MRTIKIDLNCDVGEGMPNEKELFPYLSSCSIACGGHFGDAISMQQIIVLAKQNNVKITVSFYKKVRFTLQYGWLCATIF